MPAVLPVVYTNDTIAIFIRIGNTRLCSDGSSNYLRGPQSSLKQCLNILKPIISPSGLMFVFREKKASFNSFNDRDWLGKVVVTLFKKHSNGIDVLGIFFAKDGLISTKYLLNSLAISSSPVFILSPILGFLGKFDFLLSIYTIYRFFNSSPFLCHVWIGVSVVSSDCFGLFSWAT